MGPRHRSGMQGVCRGEVQRLCIDVVRPAFPRADQGGQRASRSGRRRLPLRGLGRGTGPGRAGSGMAQGERPPTMVDVARAAGVAHITVSRVVNNEPTVVPATRDRVLRVIDELGYRRNDSARMLKSGRSTMLGAVLAGSELFELPRMLLGIEQAVKDAGHWVSLTSWQGASPPVTCSTSARGAVRGRGDVRGRPVGSSDDREHHVEHAVVVLDRRRRRVRPRPAPGGRPSRRSTPARTAACSPARPGSRRGPAGSHRCLSPVRAGRGR